MRIKGTSVRTILQAVELEFGEPGLARVKAALPADVRDRIEPVVLASSFYPVEVSAALHDAIRSVLGSGSLAANRSVGRAAARIDFAGIYKVFLRLADYDTLLRGLDRAWRQYNSAGKVVWSSLGRGRAEGRVQDVQGFTEPMWHAIAGRLEMILMLGGARAANVVVKRWSGDDVELSLSWTE